VLRQATLRTMSDRACAKAYRHARGNDGERFDGTRMICAIDPDGRAPLSSGCNGDSGGPLMAGTYDAPRVLGVVTSAAPGAGPTTLMACSAEGTNAGGHASAFSRPLRIPVEAQGAAPGRCRSSGRAGRHGPGRRVRLPRIRAWPVGVRD